MFFKSKKSEEIYKLIIAHRGLHDKFPENSIGAYKMAIEKKYAIELDVRFTKDKKIICIHDRYAKRLLGVKGKVSRKNYDEIQKYFIKNTNQKVPLLSEVLKLVDAKVALLIEVKGLINKEFENELIKELSDYKGVVYFHVKNLITYYSLRKIYKDKVFFILNPIRKRFNFIKSK